MSGFNMPPGASPLDIPGNDKPAKFKQRQRLTPIFLRPLSEREQYEADECASAQTAIPDNDRPDRIKR